MTINFTKAIELQTVRKLKSHAKVGYQDHPRGDRQCSGCSMYRPDIDPDSPCTHVQPPISPSGYCDDYQRIDMNEMARRMLGADVVDGKVVAKSFAEVMKDGPPDEARDEKGRWTSSGTIAGISFKGTAAEFQRLKDARKAGAGREEIQRLINEMRGTPAKQPLDDRIRHAYLDVTGGRWGYRATIADIRSRLSDVNRSELDNALKAMNNDEKSGTILYRNDNPRTITSEEKAGALHIGNEPRHLIYIAEPRIDKAKSFADILKDGPPDEARDERGRWTASGAAQARSTGRLAYSSARYTSPYRTRVQAYTPGDELQRVRDEKQIAAAEQKVSALHQQLSDLNSRNASEDLYWGVHRMLQQARDDLINLRTKLGKMRKYAPSVSDVHPPTALGNEAEERPKWTSFLTTLAEIKGGGRIVQINADSEPEWVENPEPDGPPVVPSSATDFGKALEKIKADALGSTYIADRWYSASGEVRFIEKRTVNVLFMRHGPTRFNNQTDMSKDRVRSWNNVPLTKEGIEDAEKAGEKLKDEGVGYIVSSDLGRAVQTSKIVGKAVGIKPIHDYGMRPWNLGKFTGMTTDEAHDGILHHVENPDEVVEGGESFNTFAHRAVETMISHIKKAGKKKMLVVSHHRNERLFASMNPDGSVNAKKYMKTGEDPGDVTEMELDLGELENALRRSGEGRGEQETKKVWSSNADLPDGVRSVLPGQAQAVWRKVANDRIKAGQSEESAIRQAWTAVKNGWSKTKDGSWVRKSWLEPDGVHEFLEAELAKLGGESSIAKPTDDVNASLQLVAIDHQNARSPFPYDQYFFANLRDDQKERILAALTDQDSLDERDIPLSFLSSVQDKVDPNKVQSMLEGAPEKYAVVVRTGPGRYCIVDGHHRLTAALLSGVKTVHVKYLDVEGIDTRVHTDDNPGAKGEPANKALDFAKALQRQRSAISPDIWETAFAVSKIDEEQMKVYGWASVTQIGDEVVLDKQDDIIPDDELEKAAHEYMLYHRSQGDMHERMGVGRCCEMSLYNQERWDLGFRAYNDPGTCLVKQFGMFVVFKVDDLGVWKRIKAGDLPEFSIGGKARRETVDA